MIVPAITLYVVLVWFLWGFFMALGWAVGTWIAGQMIGARWKLNRSRITTPHPGLLITRSWVRVPARSQTLSMRWVKFRRSWVNRLSVTG
jgi:hypothetical protein